jgi:hypothetical protein
MTDSRLKWMVSHLTFASGRLGSHDPHHFQIISDLHGSLLYSPGHDSPYVRNGSVGKYIHFTYMEHVDTMEETAS